MSKRYDVRTEPLTHSTPKCREVYTEHFDDDLYALILIHILRSRIAHKNTMIYISFTYFTHHHTSSIQQKRWTVNVSPPKMEFLFRQAFYIFYYFFCCCCCLFCVGERIEFSYSVILSLNIIIYAINDTLLLRSWLRICVIIHKTFANHFSFSLFLSISRSLNLIC